MTDMQSGLVLKREETILLVNLGPAWWIVFNHTDYQCDSKLQAIRIHREWVHDPESGELVPANISVRPGMGEELVEEDAELLADRALGEFWIVDEEGEAVQQNAGAPGAREQFLKVFGMSPIQHLRSIVTPESLGGDTDDVAMSTRLTELTRHVAAKGTTFHADHTPWFLLDQRPCVRIEMSRTTVRNGNRPAKDSDLTVVGFATVEPSVDPQRDELVDIGLWWHDDGFDSLWKCIPTNVWSTVCELQAKRHGTLG